MEATATEEAQESQQEEEPKPVTQEDLNALRSVKDKEIAAARKEMQAEIAALKKQIDDAKAPVEMLQLTGDVDQLMRQINDDPESYGKEAKRRIMTLADEVHKARRAFGDADLFARQKAAESEALKLQIEYGGDYQDYVESLARASTWQEMQLIAKEKGLELKESSAKTRSSARIDEGTGRVAQSAREAVRKKLAEIDVSTPEGAAEFNKREAELKREIDALNR